MALADFLKLNVQTRVDDRVCSFGLHYEIVSGGSLNDNAKRLCDGWEAANLTAYLDLLAADVTYEGVYASCLAKDTMLPFSKGGTSQAGTSGVNSLPANVCLVVTLQHNDPVALRSGRVYISGIASDNLVDGRWFVTWLINEVFTFRGLLSQNITNGGTEFRPVVISRIQGGIPIEPVGLPVVAARSVDVPYTQRRRTTRQYGWAPAL